MESKVQSFSDVITNSSTEVFTQADNISGVKRIIDGVLIAAGSNYTCDDLFDIIIKWDDNAIDKYKEYQIEEAKNHINDCPELIDPLSNYIIESSKSYKEVDWNNVHKLENIIIDIVSKNSKEWNILSIDDWVGKEYDYSYNSSYVITSKDPKNQEAANMLSAINHLFSYDAYYC